MYEALIYMSLNLTSLIKEPTCYKNPDNPSCIDLTLTNKPFSCQNSCVAETGLSDFHRMKLTVTKMTCQKLKLRVINYRNYKHFNNGRFRDDLLFEISNSQLEFDNNSFDEFFNMCRSTLDQHAPRKQKYARGNHMPFMNKTLSKEIMKRTKLRHKFLKERTDEIKKRYALQRHYCVSLLKKTKKKYDSLNEKDASDNKTFWKTVKPSLSDKIVSKEQILIVENEEIISEDSKLQNH